MTMTVDPSLAWAAYLLSGWWDRSGVADPPAVPANPAAVVERFRRHGVPLLTLAADARPPAAALLAEPAFRAALAVDAGDRARQEMAFRPIRAAWAALGIPALFVKAMGPLPTFPYVSSNLDILVPTAREDEARLAVRLLNYVELRHIEEPHKFLFRRFHCGDIAFDLHVHGRLEWHTEFVDSAAVWAEAASAHDTDLALVPRPEHALLIALAHAVYENKALKLIELGKLIYASRLLDVDWDRVVAGASARGWLPGLWGALHACRLWEEHLYGVSSLPTSIKERAERGAPAWLREQLSERVAGAGRSPVPLGFANSKRLFYAKMLTDPSLSPVGRTRDVVSHTLYGTRVRLRLRSQRPLLVAFDGIDGSGKSTQAALLARALTRAGLRNRVVWTRGGSSTFLRPLSVVARRFLHADTSAPAAASRPATVEDKERSRGRLFRHPVVRALWPWLVATELGVTWLARVRWPLWRGEVVVADRYVLSALVELSARLDNPGPTPQARGVLYSLPGRLLRVLAPRPERTYWFALEVAEVLARKDGAESASFLAAQARAAQPAIEACAALTIDAALPVDVLSDRLIADVIGRYEDRHRTLLNGLFWANPRPLSGTWRQPELARGEESA